ncbi:hypothetical protein CDIK_4507, partial [Cucumispora dikerogammari]
FASVFNLVLHTKLSAIGFSASWECSVCFTTLSSAIVVSLDLHILFTQRQTTSSLLFVSKLNTKSLKILTSLPLFDFAFVISGMTFSKLFFMYYFILANRGK